ncbi:Thioredoxin-1 [termite gut metagenome]|uniref:Thioredoxin-1 n=3 Tax=termite gut metagenome TaxID=433724 RepID=A0A5J4QNW9_9ZZZZ
MALEITDNNFASILAGDTPVVIDFWATWCGPCRMIAPLVEELAEQYKEKVTICKCDVDSNDALAAKYGIRNIPTLLFIKNGEIQDKQVGATDKATLEEKIKALI